jgi:DNA replication factor GINS
MYFTYLDTAYGNESVKATGLKEIEIKIGNYHYFLTMDDKINLPRWMALVLEHSKILKINDADKITILKQSLLKEKISEKFDLTSLPKYFYLEIWQELYRESKSNRDKLIPLLHKLIRIRLGKIIHLSSSIYLDSEIYKKLTIEESMFASNIEELTKSFEHMILHKKI